MLFVCSSRTVSFTSLLPIRRKAALEFELKGAQREEKWAGLSFKYHLDFFPDSVFVK